MQTKFYMQPLLVTTDAPVGGAAMLPDALGNYQSTTHVESASGSNLSLTLESQVFRTFASIPVISQTQLAAEYKDLGDALAQMQEINVGEDWSVEQPVYEAASYVATILRARAFPVPKVFNHGPASVVFNWRNINSELYLTVSGNGLSALISTPERITKRLDIKYSDEALLKPTEFFALILAYHVLEPLVLEVSSGTSESR